MPDPKSGPIQQNGPENIRIVCHVHPGARKSAFQGMYGESALKISLASPPVDGKANKALCAFLADKLSVPKANVQLLSGQTSRDKVLAVSGVSSDAARKLLFS